MLYTLSSSTINVSISAVKYLDHILIYNPSNIFACARLVETRHVGEYSLAKTGEYPRITIESEPTTISTEFNLIFPDLNS